MVSCRRIAARRGTLAYDATTSDSIAHKPSEDRNRDGSHRVCFGAGNSRDAFSSQGICLGIRPSAASRLGDDRRERCPLHLPLLARILLYSRHGRSRAIFMVAWLIAPAVAGQDLMANLSCINRAHYLYRTGSRAVRSASAADRSVGSYKERLSAV